MVRFVDDSTMLWTGSLDSFVWWVICFREFLLAKYGLQITYEVNDESQFSVFLDVKYCFKDDELITEVYHKPTDAHTYLHYSSCHPRHVFRSIVYSQSLRYRRIINKDDTLRDSLDVLAGYFSNCGYPRELVDPIMAVILNTPRSLEYCNKIDEANFSIPFLFPFGTGTDELQQHVNGPINGTLKKADIMIYLVRPPNPLLKLFLPDVLPFVLYFSDNVTLPWDTEMA